MKKEYKAPMLSKANIVIESPLMGVSNHFDWGQSKQNGRIYEDEEAAPAATPKGFWDDEY